MNHTTLGTDCILEPNPFLTDEIEPTQTLSEAVPNTLASDVAVFYKKQNVTIPAVAHGVCCVYWGLLYSTPWEKT